MSSTERERPSTGTIGLIQDPEVPSTLAGDEGGSGEKVGWVFFIPSAMITKVMTVRIPSTTRDSNIVKAEVLFIFDARWNQM
jgi:hypothetical protein